MLNMLFPPGQCVQLPAQVAECLPGEDHTKNKWKVSPDPQVAVSSPRNWSCGLCLCANCASGPQEAPHHTRACQRSHHSKCQELQNRAAYLHTCETYLHDSVRTDTNGICLRKCLQQGGGGTHLSATALQGKKYRGDTHPTKKIINSLSSLGTKMLSCCDPMGLALYMTRQCPVQPLSRSQHCHKEEKENTNPQAALSPSRQNRL